MYHLKESTFRVCTVFIPTKLGPFMKMKHVQNLLSQTAVPRGQDKVFAIQCSKFPEYIRAQFAESYRQC